MAAEKRSSKKGDKPKREKDRRPADDSDDDDDDDDEEEEEEVESVYTRRKRERGRASFLKLIRRMVSWLPLAMMLSKQPFVVRQRQPGVNGIKLRPLDLAVSGAIHWAAESPTVFRNPKIGEYLNVTARALLTPHEYVLAQQSKRAMPNEKTLQGAWKKAEAKMRRVVDKETNLLEIVHQPMPNLMLIGAYCLVVGTLLCPLVANLFEYLIIGGCICLVQGGRALGMEAQPELYVTGVVAGIALAVMEAAGKVTKPARKRR